MKPIKITTRVIPWIFVFVLLVLVVLLWKDRGIQPQTTSLHPLMAQVPAAAPPSSHSWSKMDFYEQAAQDSAKYMAAIKTDQQATVPRDTSAAHLQKSLAHLRQVLQTPPPPPLPEMKAPVHEVTPLPPDPEMARYSEMLDKIIAIQHPEKRTRRSDSVEMHVNASDTASATPVITEGSGTLTSGETIAMRLEGDLKCRSWTVPSGTKIVGTVSLENERLHIHVRSILAGMHIVPVNMEAYDLDGQPGVYVPGSLDRDASKISADQAINGLALTTLDPSVGAQAAGVGLQAVKSLLSRKVRQVRVVVRDGYQLFIK